MKQEDDLQPRPISHRLPFCHMSSQCVLYADRLALDSSHRLSSTESEDTREKQLIEQLRTHLLTCSTCRTTLAEVSQQRDAIRNVLLEGEREVPSTAPRILAVLRQEMTPSTSTIRSGSHPSKKDVPTTDEVQISPISQRLVDTPVPVRRRMRWTNIFSVVAAAVLVLASIAVLSHFLFLRNTNTSSMSSAGNTSIVTTTPTLVPSASWSSVILTYVLGNKTVIANYDPLSGRNAALGVFEQKQVAVDGVAHSGYQLLYHIFDGTQTRYYLYPQVQQAIFATPGYSGPAIWSGGDHDHYLFISTQQGIVRFDTLTHTSRVLSAAPNTGQVLFSRDGYLYYVKSTDNKPYSDTGILYRINDGQSNAATQQVTPCSQATNFWLNPTGTLIYYQCLSQSKNDLYTVNVDGSNAHLLRSNAGQVVGYAANNSLIVVQSADGHYQIVQLGTDVQQDLVVLADTAPGALSVRSGDVAVAPYGAMLVAKGTYTNNVERLWYGDLMTGGTQEVHLPNGVHTVSPIGWDRLTLAS